MEKRFQKRRVLPAYFEEPAQIEWSTSKKQNLGRAYETRIQIRNIILNTVLILIQITNLDLSEYLLIGYTNLKNFRLFILQYTKKKTIKNVSFGNFFSLVRNRKNRNNFKFQNLN